jgi:hypothetical protein
MKRALLSILFCSFIFILIPSSTLLGQRDVKATATAPEALLSRTISFVFMGHYQVLSLLGFEF